MSRDRSNPPSGRWRLPIAAAVAIIGAAAVAPFATATPPVNTAEPPVNTAQPPVARKKPAVAKRVVKKPAAKKPAVAPDRNAQEPATEKQAAEKQAAEKQAPEKPAAERDVAAQREDDRRKAVLQQARQLEGMLQGPLAAELERVRATNGGLSPEARQEILAAGTQGVKAAALEFAERQFSGQPQKKSFDPRGVIHAAVEKAVAGHFSADELAAYRREHSAWLERRARAARVLILAKVDRVLDLTATQRQRIEADLVRLWQPEWVRELDDNGGVTINNYKPAPDFAAKAVVPHLDERQRGEWKKWCEQAGWQQLQHYFGWPFGGLVMQPDPWWKP